MSGLIDIARDLPPTAVAGIGAVAAFLVVLAAGAQLAAWRLRQQLHVAEEELVDRETGLLPRSALRVRLGAELAWASTTRTPLAVAALRVRGSRFRHATRVLRESMREEEAAFLLGEQRIAVELWDADPEAAVIATRRLGRDLARAGHPVVDVGVACAPRDGADVETLVAAAQRDLRPVDDPAAPGADTGPDGAARGPVAHALVLLRGVLPWFAAMGALLLVTWRLLPAAIEPALEGTRDATEVAYALVTLVGVPLGAALLHASCWNLGGGAAPASRPFGSAGRRATAVLGALILVPLAWGILFPTSPAALSDGFGAALATIVLVVLVLVHGRQLVHAAAPVLVGLALLGGAVTWAAVEGASLPVVANGGRLLFAAALGALLARYVERASWIVGLALLAAVVDLWSVYSESGVTNRVLDDADGGGGRVLDLLLFTGPRVDGSPLFAMGVTDLVFLALFLAWGHDWRIDLRLVAGALLAACWVALVVAQGTGDAVPVLPFLAAAMVFVVAVRSTLLRRRVREWRASAGAGPFAS